MFRAKEQERFSARIARHIQTQDGPLLLEGGTGIGKTRAYLAALAEAGIRAAIVLPTHALIDQLPASADLDAVGLSVTAFRPRRRFPDPDEYLAHKEAARAAQFQVCTMASVMVDQRLRGNYNGVTEGRYLLFDEADQLRQMAELVWDAWICPGELEDAGIELTTAAETLRRLAEVEDAELRGRAQVMQDALADQSWFCKIGVRDGGLYLWHRIPGRLLKKVANRPSTAFVSATLSSSVGEDGFREFRYQMGIEKPSALSAAIEPVEHGKLSIEAPVVARAGMDADKYRAALLEAAPGVIAGAPRPCLVVTPSFSDAERLGALIPEAVVRRREEGACEAADRVAPDGVLIAAAAWAGMDTPTRWASVVVPRIPFSPPVVLDGYPETPYEESVSVGRRRMRQVLGRGLRAPDAQCAVYILDDRYPTVKEFVPVRFQGWDEGGQLEEALRRERRRHRLLRPHALAHHGRRCMAPGSTGKEWAAGEEHILDVHHLDRIAEGERRTTVHDVVILCANHHRLAHRRTPPVPVKELTGPCEG